MKTFCLFFIWLFVAQISVSAPREYYELRTYRFKDANQQQRVESYLEKALLPALHRMGIKKVGVFKPLETDSTYGKKLMVLIPFPSFEAFDGIQEKLSKDAQYLNEGKDYIDAAYNNPPYARISTTLLKAFTGMTESAVPGLAGPKSQRVYELRSYEGHTEKIYRNKVQMFNDGDEFGLFKRLGFNVVFCGEVLSGSTMPNLMYISTFDDMASREAHWKTFVEDPQWKKLKAMPEYQNNISKIVITFLRATEYSDL